MVFLVLVKAYPCAASRVVPELPMASVSVPRLGAALAARAHGGTMASPVEAVVS